MTRPGEASRVGAAGAPPAAARRPSLATLASLAALTAVALLAPDAQAQPVDAGTAEGEQAEPGEAPDESLDEPITVVDDDDDDEEEEDDDDDTDAPSGGPGADVDGFGRPITKTDEVYIFGNREQLGRAAGSAARLGAAELDRFEHDDIHRVLERVPGVYLREEDGFGLRPNIGIRGTSSERSAKVTLMEDGVLFGPAPYSAPAAYYFPLTTRMTAVEVYKGPAAIAYGPQTIGGAINLVTRSIPFGTAGAIDLGAGQYGYQKTHAWVGHGTETVGVLLEGVRLANDGFKTLDNGGDTGFNRNELMLKLRWNTDPRADVFQRVQLKLGYSDEVSDETYLGVTPGDFRRAPYHRYAASQRDRMEWDRTQAELRYQLEVGRVFDLSVVAYRHDLDRAWRKLNRVRSGPPLNRLLQTDPQGQAAVLVDVLRGREDSTEGSDPIVGTNARGYISQGVQALARWHAGSGDLTSRLDVGARIHADEIRRHHTEDAYAMRNGTLVPTGEATWTTTRNTGDAMALAAWLLEELTLWRRLTLTPGVRVEAIRTGLRDTSEGSARQRAENETVVVLPGAGIHFALTDEWGVLAGVHRGFSPLGPGQPDGVNPETSINYEAGARYQGQRAHAELIGYLNDYHNILANCTLSAGCDDEQLDVQFNGGEILVYGIEATAGLTQRLWRDLHLRLDLQYTLTLSEFARTFSSNDPIFGNVEAGDALPYLPDHMATGTLGVAADQWGLDFMANYRSAMRDSPGQGNITESEEVPDRWLLNATARYNPTKANEIYARVDNLTDNTYLAARRPYGGRPGMPRALYLGYKHHFGASP